MDNRLGVKSGEMGLSSGSGNHGLGDLEEAALPLCSSASTLAIQSHPDCCYIPGADVNVRENEGMYVKGLHELSSTQMCGPVAAQSRRPFQGQTLDRRDRGGNT